MLTTKHMQKRKSQTKEDSLGPDQLLKNTFIASLLILILIILFYLTTIRITLGIASFYLILVGTWRVANATADAPIGPNLSKYEQKEKEYNPLSDLIAVREIGSWFLRTIRRSKRSGSFASAVVLHRHFNWGLIWLLSGLTLQFFLQLWGWILEDLEGACPN